MSNMCSITDLCFMCSNDNKCNIVDNKIITQVEYLMPEITIIKLTIPLRICSICEKNLKFFNTFKQNCVENILRLEAKIKETQYNIDIEDKYSTPETNINKIHEIYIKEEVYDEIDTPTEKDFFAEEISIKEHSLQENPPDRKFGDVLQEIRKEECTSQTATHLHGEISVSDDDKSAQNSDDPDNVISVNNEINCYENILVSDSAGRKIYTCLICKKIFKKLSDLKLRHMKIHLGKKDFQCAECKKWFSRKSHLSTHMKLHTGAKDFQCKKCKKRFSQKSTLTRHMKQHTGLKEFQCNECKKMFAQKSNLIAHMKLHVNNNIKDFNCSVCNKMFSHKIYLNRHMKIHARIKNEG